MPNKTLGPPPFLNGRYRLIRQLGQGGMGLVFQAQDELLKRDVSIKFLTVDQISNTQRFFREARVVAGLSHPHIMTLYDAGEAEGWHYLVMEFIAGDDLITIQQKSGEQLTFAKILRIIHQVLQALAYAHQKGVVHRDIKPANIMLTADGQAKVTDFGLAVSTDESRLTADNVLVGTPLYLAPECIQGRPADARSDLYALGVVWYELLVGQNPFQTSSTVTTFIEIINRTVPPLSKLLPNISPKIETIILTLLEKDPQRRFASAQAVLQELPLAQEPMILHGDAEDTTVSSPISNTLIEQLSKTSTTIQQAIISDLWAQETAVTTIEALESERKQLAARLQTHILKPLNLLLDQAQMYEQTFQQQPQASMVASVLATLARQLQQQVRDLEANLHPTLLSSLGLEPALESFTNQIRRTHGIDIILKIAQLPQQLPDHIELILYRTTQVIVETAIVTGRATHITINAQTNEKNLIYSLRDNRISHTEQLPTLIAQQLIQFGGKLDTNEKDGEFTTTLTFKSQTPNKLTPREMDVLRCLAEGLTNKEIAQHLDITPRTVNFHLDNLYTKLGVNSRTEAVIYALRQNLFK